MTKTGSQSSTLTTLEAASEIAEAQILSTEGAEVAAAVRKIKRMRRGKAGGRIPEILAAAAAEFAERGFLGARMDDIAARVGVTKPIIYRHFKNKRALFEALLRGELMVDFSELAKQILAYEGGVKPLLRAIIARVKFEAPHAPESFASFRLIIAEGYRIPDFGRDFHRQGLTPVREAIMAIFERAMAQGKMRKANADFASREFFAPYFHAMTVLVITGLDEWGPWQVAEYLDYAVELFCHNYEIED